MPIVAIVPAAGQSRRMGAPKLTLPLAGKPLIGRVVETLLAGGASRVLCVVRSGDEALHRHAREAGGTVSPCDPPPADMRASVEHGLSVLEAEGSPPEGILLCPADSPGISKHLVSRVLAAFASDPSRIVLPRSGGKRGHPVAIPWALARAIRDLPPGTGINALHARHDDRRTFLDLDEDPDTFADLDTPQDYRDWQTRLERPSREG